MKIESIIRREHGTNIKLGDQEYAFVADSSGCHVCDVDNEAHIDRLLSIKEGFKPATEAAPVESAEGKFPPVKIPRKTKQADPVESAEA